MRTMLPSLERLFRRRRQGNVYTKLFFYGDASSSITGPRVYFSLSLSTSRESKTWDLLLPLAWTLGRRDQQILVSLLKDMHIVVEEFAQVSKGC